MRRSSTGRPTGRRRERARAERARGSARPRLRAVHLGQLWPWVIEGELGKDAAERGCRVRSISTPASASRSAAPAARREGVARAPSRLPARHGRPRARSPARRGDVSSRLRTPPRPIAACRSHRARDARRARASRACRPPEQPDGARADVCRFVHDQPRQERADVVLAVDRRLEGARLGRRREPTRRGARGSRGMPRARVLPAEREEGEHLQPVCALTEAVECRRRFGVGERVGEVELGQRGFGGVQVSSEHASLIRVAQVLDQFAYGSSSRTSPRTRASAWPRERRAAEVGSRAERTSSSSKRSRSSRRDPWRSDTPPAP